MLSAHAGAPPELASPELVPLASPELVPLGPPELVPLVPDVPPSAESRVPPELVHATKIATEAALATRAE